MAVIFSKVYLEKEEQNFKSSNSCLISSKMKVFCIVKTACKVTQIGHFIFKVGHEPAAKRQSKEFTSRFGANINLNYSLPPKHSMVNFTSRRKFRMPRLSDRPYRFVRSTLFDRIYRMLRVVLLTLQCCNLGARNVKNKHAMLCVNPLLQTCYRPRINSSRFANMVKKTTHSVRHAEIKRKLVARKSLRPPLYHNKF